jgi:hypothetical protein
MFWHPVIADATSIGLPDASGAVEELRRQPMNRRKTQKSQGVELDDLAGVRRSLSRLQFASVNPR